MRKYDTPLILENDKLRKKKYSAIRQSLIPNIVNELLNNIMEKNVHLIVNNNDERIYM